MRPTLREAPALLMLALPAWMAVRAGSGPLPGRELDSVGHVWTVWNGSLGSPLRSQMVAWPQGADLLPILGGWLDIFVASTLVRLGLEPAVAFNLVLVAYLALAGLGAFALVRVLGAGPWAGAAAGLLAQLDPTLHWNLVGGRSEQLATGFLALAFATALACWRRPGAWRWLACGLAGAGTVYASWEYGFWLAFAMIWLAPFVWWSGRPPGALRRWGLAALSCALVVGPFALLFLVRSAGIRELDEGLSMMSVAPRHSVPLLGWFTQADAVRMGTPMLLALLTLPWTVRREDRRLLLGAAAGLLLCLLLALGPQPGLWLVGDLAWAQAVAPYTLLQSTPVLGWFHTPDRLLIGWSVAAAAAAGLLLHATWSRPWPLPLRVLLVAGLTFGLGLGNVHRSVQVGAWNYTPWRPVGGPALEALAEAPVEGALLDLPPRDPGIETLMFMELQLAHQRPSPYHATLPHLTTADNAALGRRYRLVAWLDRDNQLEAPSVEEVEADLERLREDGYAFLTLHPRMVPRDRRQTVRRLLKETLGEPYVSNGQIWMSWSLDGLEPPLMPGPGSQQHLEGPHGKGHKAPGMRGRDAVPPGTEGSPPLGAPPEGGAPREGGTRRGGGPPGGGEEDLPPAHED